MALTLFCLVHGDSASNAFSVKIPPTDTVSDLKKLIKAEKQNKFHNIDADELTLWAVSISITDATELQKMVVKLNDIEEAQKKELIIPTHKIDKVFPGEPADEHIHVMVEPPTNLKKVICKTTYGRISKTFMWRVTRETTTLANLKVELRKDFPFPDGTEDKDVDVSCDPGGDISVVRLPNDKELAEIIWATRGRWVEMSLVVETSQRPFSSWNFEKMKPVFKVDATSFLELTKFQGGSANTNGCEENIAHALDDLLEKHKTSPHISGANEATRCEFISSVIYGVASCYDGQIKVYPQYEISGSHGRGPVDWAIKVGDTIIAITEAKKEDLNQGVGQNVIQLQASTQHNNKKRKREEVMYGIVTTGLDWVIVQVTSSNNNTQVSSGNSVQLSSLSPFVLPINETVLDREIFKEKLKVLFSQLLWILDEQLKLQEVDYKRPRKG